MGKVKLAKREDSNEQVGPFLLLIFLKTLNI